MLRRHLYLRSCGCLRNSAQYVHAAQRVTAVKIYDTFRRCRASYRCKDLLDGFNIPADWVVSDRFCHKSQ
jgi:hypothetical protein